MFTAWYFRSKGKRQFNHAELGRAAGEKPRPKRDPITGERYKSQESWANEEWEKILPQIPVQDSYNLVSALVAAVRLDDDERLGRALDHADEFLRECRISGYSADHSL